MPAEVSGVRGAVFHSLLFIEAPFAGTAATPGLVSCILKAAQIRWRRA